MYTTTRTRRCLTLGFLLGALQVQAQALKDTTFAYAISYRNIPFQINLHQIPGSKATPAKYEMSLAGNKLTITMDTAKEPDEITLTGFENPPDSPQKKGLPVDFGADIFRQQFSLLLVAHTTLTGGTAMDLLNAFNRDEGLGERLGRIYQQIKQSVLLSVESRIKEEVRNEQQEAVREINRRHTATVDSLLNIIDEVDEENKYGGQFEFSDTNRRGIRVYHNMRVKTDSGSNILHYIPYDTNAIVFYPNSVVLKTFNNFIDHIHVDGYVKIKNGLIPVTFYNAEFSISLRSLFERAHYLAFRIPYRVASPVVRKPAAPKTSKAPGKQTAVPADADLQEENAVADSAQHHTTSARVVRENPSYIDFGNWRYRRYNPADTVYPVDYKTYLINISDLIKINSYKEHITFMIKNGAYRLDSSQKFVRFPRRSFYDYLNVVTFLDFLGVVEKTPNSLIQIEGRIRLPFRLKTSRFSKNSYIYRNVICPKLDAYLNASFINGSSADTRYGSIFSPNNRTTDSLYIDNFDLIRKNNIRTGFEFGFLKGELKNSSLNYYLDYGLHFARTNLQYRVINPSDTDEVRQFNTWSMSHGPIFRLEYRPDQNLGMDLSFSYNLNQRLLNSDNDNLRVMELKGPIQPNPFPRLDGMVINHKRNRNNYKVEFNTYFMVRPNTSNGGLYFRLSNYISHDFKQIFPQVMVGYSTRLNGMVKNLRKEKS